MSPAFSLKLKNMILLLTRGLICLFKWSYSQRCFDVAQRCWNQRWNRQRWLNVVERCKLQRWRTQRSVNVDLTLCDVATSYQPKNNVWTNVEMCAGKTFKYKCCRKNGQYQSISIVFRGGSRTDAKSKMESSALIITGWKPLNIVKKSLHKRLHCLHLHKLWAII